MFEEELVERAGLDAEWGEHCLWRFFGLVYCDLVAGEQLVCGLVGAKYGGGSDCDEYEFDFSG